MLSILLCFDAINLRSSENNSIFYSLFTMFLCNNDSSLNEDKLSILLKTQNRSSLFIKKNLSLFVIDLFYCEVVTLRSISDSFLSQYFLNFVSRLDFLLHGAYKGAFTNISILIHNYTNSQTRNNYFIPYKYLFRASRYYLPLF